MDILRRFPDLVEATLLHGLDAATRDAFLNGGEVLHFPKPAQIQRQDESPDGAFVVLSGTVEEAYLSPEGNRAILRHARTPSIVGLFETIARVPATTSCLTIKDTKVLALSPAHIDKFIGDTTFQRNLARLTCETLNRSYTAKAVDQFFGSEQRICRYLLEFAGGTRLFSQTQAYLANVVGCTRQTVNRELSHLRDREIIAVEKGRILILDPDGLESRIKDLDDRSRK